MDTKEMLNREFFGQDFSSIQPDARLLEKYKDIARNYARMENAVAVLSDLRTNASYIYYGGFSRLLGIRQEQKEDKVQSIWEEEIFRLIHPDDLAEKHLQELRFFHFVRHQPKKVRGNYYLMSKLRMRTAGNSYVPVSHRMFYIPLPSGEAFWLALCLYSPLLSDMTPRCVIVNSVNGHVAELEKQNDEKILSRREAEVLRLIDKGLTSKEIAELLAISPNTVSRHRQEILGKLQVKNSIEACRIARDLELI